jgi:peptidoglycan/xylan/chitin deacetylase (PgdA/CDA1 family)
VDPTFEWGVTRVTPRQFKAILSYLYQNGYQTISLQTIINDNQQQNKKSVIITFDDAYENIIRYALPVLQEFNFTATIFVITGYIGYWNKWDVNLGRKRFKHLSWPQLRILHNQGFEIESHTVSHPILTKLNSRIMHYELEYSKKSLEDYLGKNVSFISFPFGRFNEKVIECARKVGYKKGCGVGVLKKNKYNTESFVLNRKAYYLLDSIWNLRAKLNETSWNVLENIKLNMINFCSYGTSLVKPVKIMIRE